MPNGRVSPPKPLPGSQVNFNHPLAYGLRHCILMNEGGGSAWDLVYRSQGALRGGAVWKIGPSGTAVDFTAGATGVDVNFTEGGLVMPSGRNISVFVKCTQAATTTASVTLGSMDGAGIDAYHWQTGVNQSGPIWILSNAAAIDSGLSASKPNPPANTDQSVGYAYTRGVGCFFFQSDPLNGILTSTVLNATAPIAVTGNPSTIGSKWGATSTSWNGMIYLTYIWDRVLSLTEFEWLDSDPYVFLNRSVRHPYAKYLLPSVPVGTPITAGSFSAKFLFFDTGDYSAGV